MANREIEWSEMGHAELMSALGEGLGERDRRVAEMQALMGVQAPASRGPGRPRKDETLTARQQQLAAAESEAVQ